MNFRAIGLLILCLITIIGGFHLYVRTRSVNEYVIAPFHYSFPLEQVEKKDNRIEMLRSNLKQSKSPLLMIELAQALLKRARQTNSNADFQESEKLARNTIRIAGDILPAQLILIETLQHRHEFESAIQLIEKQKKTHPDDPALLDLSARMSLARGEYESAAGVAQRLIDLLPRSGSYALLGQILEAQGKIPQTEQAYRNAFTLEDVGDVSGSAYLRGLFGRFLLRRDRIPEARVLIDEGLRLQTNSSFLIGLKADLDFAIGNYRSAEKIYFSAFDISPSPVYLVKAAKSRKEAGKTKSAVELLDQTMELIEASNQKAAPGQYNYETAFALVERETRGDLQKALPLIEEELKSRSTAELLALKIKALKGLNKTTEAQSLLDQHRAQLSSRRDLL